MGLSCGLIGLPLCGKTTIFNAITSAQATSFGGAEVNRMVINVPDQRMQKLLDMYHPRKLVPATLEIVDIPGLKPNSQGDGRGSRLLGYIKDVEALLHVARSFDDANPARDVETIDLELIAADSITLENKITRLAKRMKAGDKEAARESADCQKVYGAVQQGTPARRLKLSPQELNSIWECNLVSLKPVVYIANIRTMEESNNKHVTALKQLAVAEGAEMIIVCGLDEADLNQLEPEERKQFMKDLGLEESSMERLIHAAYRRLGLISFFTVGEDEVRAWTCRQGDKAPVAAGKIHTDMLKGFIRMEVKAYTDLIDLGSEAAVAKAGKQHVEGKEYEVQDGDIVEVLFSGRSERK